jgi:hypothetical protein
MGFTVYSKFSTRIDLLMNRNKLKKIPIGLGRFHEKTNLRKFNRGLGMQKVDKLRFDVGEEIPLDAASLSTL